ncbi:hypothetical protein STEG23_024587 [Scotinomys teguina]
MRREVCELRAGRAQGTSSVNDCSQCWKGFCSCLFHSWLHGVTCIMVPHFLVCSSTVGQDRFHIFPLVSQEQGSTGVEDALSGCDLLQQELRMRCLAVIFFNKS